MYDKRLQTMDDDMDAILDSIDPILFYQASNQRLRKTIQGYTLFPLLSLV